MSVGEETFTFQGTERLLAVYHRASGDTRCALLFVHPFGEEKKCAHRTLVETARALAQHGVASMRFDLSGCGDSEGAFAKARFASWSDDIAAAWDELRKRVPGKPAGLLGLRMGAALAAQTCTRLNTVTALILWQPVVNGRREFASEIRRLSIQQMMTEGKATLRRKEMLASLECGEGTIELDGYTVSAEVYRDICNVDLAQLAEVLPRATGVTQFSRSNHAIESFARNAGIASCVVEIPPIWIRSDFMPTRATGESLAVEGVLPIFEKAQEES